MSHARRSRVLVALALAIALMLPVPIVMAQTPNDTTKAAISDAIKLFVDSPVADDYLKTEISFVDFVRDRALADVYILVSSLYTASGGKEYTVTVHGQQRFEGMVDTLRYVSQESDTEDIIRSGLVKTMIRGLVRYASRTSLGPQLNISFLKQEKAQPKVDKWKHWVFTLSGNGYFNGEQGYRYHNLWGTITAKRVTEKLKLIMTLYGAETGDLFEYDGSEIRSYSDNKSFQITPVFAIDDHWSWLINTVGGSSTYSNRSGYLLGALGAEYNIFPYSESTRRALRIEYNISFRTIKYYEETIYDRITESRWQEELLATLELIQP